MDKKIKQIAKQLKQNPGKLKNPATRVSIGWRKLAKKSLGYGNEGFKVTIFGAYQPGPKFWVPVVARKLKGTNITLWASKLYK